MYGIMSPANSDSFTFAFQCGFLLFLFCSLITVARTSNTVLNKSDKSGQPCLVLDVRGNAYSFSPLSMMLAMGLSYTAFIMLRYASSMPTFWRVFIINGC